MGLWINCVQTDMHTLNSHSSDTLLAAMKHTLLVGIAMIALLISALIYWSVTVPLPQAISASGTIKSTTPNIQVRSPMHGAIAKTNTRDGAKVSRGETLLVMDTSDDFLRRIKERRRIVALRLKALRIEAELSNRKDLEVPEALALEVAALQMQQSQSREQTLLALAFTSREQAEELLQARAVGLSTTGERLLERLGFEQQQVAKAESVAQSFEQLRAGGRIKATELERVQRTYLGLQATAAETHADFARTQLALSDARHELRQLPVKRRMELTEAVLDIERQLATHRHELDEIERRIEKAHIRSPVDGEVLRLRHARVGALVPQFETLIEIVPSDSSVIAELRIPPAHISSLDVGDEVEVALRSQSDTGERSFRGIVKDISAGTIADESGTSGVYLAQVDLILGSGTDSAKNRNPDASIRTGQKISAYINTGHRTLADILVAPLSRALQQAP